MIGERPMVEAPMVEHALWYARWGLKVIPAHNKAPWMKDWPGLASRDEAQILSWYAQFPDAQVAGLLGEPYVVLDVDASHGGLDSLAELEAAYHALPDTVTSLSGSGGGSCHKLFTPPAGVVIPNRLSWRPGIDVLVHHKCIILPPSPHPSGRRYTWECDFGPEDIAVAELPAWLVALLCDGTTGGHGPAAITDPQAPIPEGQREATLVRIAGGMRRAGVSQAGILATLEVENQRCSPPLAGADLARIATSMMRYHVEAQCIVNNEAPPGWYGHALNGTNSNGVHPPGIPATWRQELFTYKNGHLHPNQFNIATILRHHEHWQKPENALWYDVLTGRHMIDEQQLDELMLDQIGVWFGGQEKMPLTTLTTLEKCLHARCREHPRDRIQIWLNSLPAWDTQERLTTWLTKVGNAAADAYTRHLSWRLPVSMVARALNPGCQYREVLIFEGPENIGKSHIVEALASRDFYIVLSMSLESKEAHMMLQRCWLAELAELDSLSRTEEARLKAYITMEDDVYIPKYKNESVSLPRRAVFVGTTNDRAYLKGANGNTRFLPLWVPGPINLDALRAMRDQLFAEALVAYHAAGDAWWAIPPEIEAEAALRREKRRVKSEYEGPLGEWLDHGRAEEREQFWDATTDTMKWRMLTYKADETSWQEIAKHFLKISSPEHWKDRSLQMQIASALKALGWQQTELYPEGGGGTRVYGWRKEADPADAEAWNF